jgi:hypothetical protein
MAKLTPVRGESDVDFFISLQTTMPLQDVYEGLFNLLSSPNLKPHKQNVSIHINYLGTEVDLTPGRLQIGGSGDHSLFVRRKNTWKQTNIATHIKTVRGSGRMQEIRAIKIWRNCHRLDLPSFYLELTTIEALRGRQQGTQLAQNVFDTLGYIAGNLVNARVIDPANTGNVISDDLTQAEKLTIASKAKESLARERGEKYFGNAERENKSPHAISVVPGRSGNEFANRPDRDWTPRNTG